MTSSIAAKYDEDEGVMDGVNVRDVYRRVDIPNCRSLWINQINKLGTLNC